LRAPWIISLASGNFLFAATLRRQSEQKGEEENEISARVIWVSRVFGSDPAVACTYDI